MFQKKINKNNYGYILIFTLLVVFGTLVGAVSLATIILGNIKRARLSLSSSAAYYSAESGIEEALYKIRKKGEIPDDLIGSCIGVGCSLDVAYDSTAQYPIILENQSIQIDILSETGAAAAGVKKVVITCPVTSPPQLWLEIASTPLTTIGAWGADAQNKTVLLKPCDDNTISIESFSVTESYSLRIKTLYNEFRDAANPLSIQAFDDSGGVVDLSSKLRITGRGTAVDTSQKIIINMPKRSPILGFYDYVLYSEESIVKLEN